MKRSTLILPAGDFAALTVFVFIGQRNHETLDALQLLLNVAAFGVPWVVAAWLVGAFRGDREGHPYGRAFMARSLNAWLIAAPLGVILRALALGRAVIPTPFALVTLGLGGAFVLGWRLAAGALMRGSSQTGV
ncbi:MAG: DUF3054 domain-containing protein [Chloroflexi bacterium]|nr:DUF3054 domain-containing protein [Chloroflexota bacterium]